MKLLAEPGPQLVERRAFVAHAAVKLEPPQPLYSLGLALLNGCTIEEIGGKNVLVRPKRIKPKPKEEKQDDRPDIPF